MSFWAGRFLAAQRIDQLVSAGLDRVDPALPGEPLPDLVPRPGSLDHVEQQSRDGPAPSTFDVKTSTVSPDSSGSPSGTSRPLTLAPMVACPTSVWMLYAKSIGVAPTGRLIHIALGREHEDLVGLEVDP